MNAILAIDPAPVRSAWVFLDGNRLADCRIEANGEILKMMNRVAWQVPLVIERVACYGMPVGESVFTTCVWFGRFWQNWLACGNRAFHSMSRKEVVTRLCGTSRAKDGNVRQVCLDRLGEIGTKKGTGPLYLVRKNGSKDIWQALGLALAWQEQYQEATT